MVLAVIFGIIGAVGMILAYPIYRSGIKKARDKHRARILELAAQLCGEQ